jgi:hypothetical protein
MFCKSPYGYDKGMEEKCVCSYEEGHTFCYIKKNDKIIKTEVLYVHLQKREMEVKTSNLNFYLMIPNKFINFYEIGVNDFNQISNEAAKTEPLYRNMMRKKLQLARKKHYKEMCWWELKLIRMRIKRAGGMDLNGK